MTNPSAFFKQILPQPITYVSTPCSGFFWTAWQGHHFRISSASSLLGRCPSNPSFPTRWTMVRIYFFSIRDRPLLSNTKLWRLRTIAECACFRLPKITRHHFNRNLLFSRPQRKQWYIKRHEHSEKMLNRLFGKSLWDIFSSNRWKINNPGLRNCRRQNRWKKPSWNCHFVSAPTIHVCCYYR